MLRRGIRPLQPAWTNLRCSQAARTCQIYCPTLLGPLGAASVLLLRAPNYAPNRHRNDGQELMNLAVDAFKPTQVYGPHYPVSAFMETLMVLSALGADRPGLVDELAHQVAESGCQVGESRMTVLGGEFAVIMLISGNWNSVAKFENLVPRTQENLGLHIQIKRTQERSDSAKVLPYAVEVVSIDRSGIVSDVANFFARRHINIEEVYTSTYPAPHTRTDMFSLHMTVGIPGEMSIAAVRGEFMDFCDDLNLDAVLAPVK
jgi:glycine cleavage system transcriptional repressor